MALPHGPLQPVSDRIWRVEGEVPGTALRRVMTVIRASDDGLVLHSGMLLDEPTMAQLESLGRPSVLLVPGRFHRMDAAALEARYPEMTVYCPAGATAAVSRVVRVHGDFDSFPDTETLSVHHLPGTAEAEGVVRIASDDGTTLVFNDLIFNMPHQRGAGGFLLRYITRSSGGPRISRLARWSLVRDGKLLREQLICLAEVEDLRRIIVSHHEVIEQEPSAVLRRIAASL